MDSVFKELLIRQTHQDPTSTVSSPSVQTPPKKGKQDGRRGKGTGLFKSADAADWDDQQWHKTRGRDDTNGSWGVAWRPLTVAFSTSISRNLRSLTESFLWGLLDSCLTCDVQQISTGLRYYVTTVNYLKCTNVFVGLFDICTSSLIIINSCPTSQ